MSELRFNVFGRLIVISGEAGAWRAFYFGSEGKRRPADFVVPGELAEHELREYLADLFHEDATPRNHSVVQLS